MNVHPYLNFPGNTEEAFNFYQSVFGGELSVSRFRDLQGNPMGVPEKELDKIAHIELPLGSNGTKLMATDALEAWPEVTLGTANFIMLDLDSESEAQRIFDALASGGRVTMPLQRTEWAEKYGTCTDKYGVQWMVMCIGSG